MTPADPRHVSSEAARCEQVASGRCNGECVTCAERDAEAAPPRATTPEPWAGFLSEAEEAKRSLNHSLTILLDYTVDLAGKQHHAKKIKAMFAARSPLAGSPPTPPEPSRESGARDLECGQTDAEEWYDAVALAYTHRNEKATVQITAKGLAAAADRLSTLQRDAAQMRAAATRAADAIDALFAPAHADGCLYVRDNRMPCQCGSFIRELDAVHKARNAASEIRAISPSELAAP
jgi:hypothetical protein